MQQGLSLLRIRKGNRNLKRYNLSDDEILHAAKFAYDNHYGSIALQSGELESHLVTDRIETLLHKIKELSNGELGITLSVGEQEPEVYRKWFDAGAHRYLYGSRLPMKVSTGRSILKIESMISIEDWNA